MENKSHTLKNAVLPVAVGGWIHPRIVLINKRLSKTSYLVMMPNPKRYFMICVKDIHSILKGMLPFDL